MTYLRSRVQIVVAVIVAALALIVAVPVSHANVIVQPEPPVPAPVITDAEPGGNQTLVLLWTNSALDYDLLVVERRQGDGPWQAVQAVAGNATMAVDDGLNCTVVYEWRVYAVRDGKQSAYTEVIEGNLPCSIIAFQQHIMGGTFETGPLDPALWINTSTSDNRVRCDKLRADYTFVERSYTGRCGLMMRGNAASNSKVQQNLSVSGMEAGETLAFSGYVRGNNVQAGMAIRIVVVYPEGAGTTQQRVKRLIPITQGSYDWTPYQSDIALEAAPSAVRFQIRNRANGGKIFLDNLALTSSF